MDSIKVFVPGRLCLFGEHSDWAGKYRLENDAINKGYAIVTGIEEGIEAEIKKASTFKIKNGSKNFECEMNLDKLKEVAGTDPYWCYAAGVAAVLKGKYNVGGIDIDITNVTLPEKKGLSSSAALCVLIARAYSKLYNLNLDIKKEMDIAYLGETQTPSKCGRLDQACAFGKKPILMEFDGDKINYKEIPVGGDFYFVFADLMSHKDTVKILNDLNKSFPFPRCLSDEKVQYCLGALNELNVTLATKLLKEGDSYSLGKLMIKAQKDFDKLVAPNSSELEAPILHNLFNDSKVHEYCYGYKGVGSQGDGSIQFLCKDKESQRKLLDYLTTDLKLNAYSLTFDKTSIIKKAIIPLAGYGTRMFPVTKAIKKAFLPLPDKDGLTKPVLMILLEELYNSGITEFCLVIDEEEKEIYDAFFSDLSKEVYDKLSPEAKKYEDFIRKIGSMVTYAYQKEKLGLGHAVSCAKEFAGNEDVLLVLGDQVYQTNNVTPVSKQLLDYYAKNRNAIVTASLTPLEDVYKYGILTGEISNNANAFSVSKMTEKPDTDFASKYLYTTNDGKKEYYSVFGEYVLTPKVFELLDQNINNGKTEKGEYQITSVLDEIRKTDGLYAFIPDGEMVDVGNSNSYQKAFVKRLGTYPIK